MFTVYTPKEIIEMDNAEGKLVAVESSIFEVILLMCKAEGDNQAEKRARYPRGSGKIRDEYLIKNPNGTYWFCKRKYIYD